MTSSNVSIPPDDKIAAEGLKMSSSTNGQDWVLVTLPILTVSEANGGVKKSFKRGGKTCYKAEHWMDKHVRHKRQKGMVGLMLKKHAPLLKLPCLVTLTRYAPDKLDRHDNLPMSMKWILDAVCEIITGDYRPGKADEDERIEVKYNQITSKEYGVRILITF